MGAVQNGQLGLTALDEVRFIGKGSSLVIAGIAHISRRAEEMEPDAPGAVSRPAVKEGQAAL